ncbi:neuronal acetylcholine receptor subunit alpha-10-like [Littorina saxatilis]
MAKPDASFFPVIFLWIVFLCRNDNCGLVKAHPHEKDVAVNLDHESHVYLHVLDELHYVKHLRPAASRNDSVVVDMDMALMAVHGLDTSTGILETTLRLSMQWQDPRLMWNASAYGGVKELSVPVDSLWSPNLNLFSTAQGTYKLLNGKHARLQDDGVVTWLCDVMLRSLCPVDLSKFPFDAQTCVLTLESGTALDESIHVHISQSPPQSLMGSTKGHVDTSMAGEWMLLGDELSVSPSKHSVELQVRLGRKSQLYQCLVVGPVVLLALLVPCVFLLPADSTAKITLGGLLQVSICICLRTLCDMLHHNHGSVPSIAIFSIASLALTSISIVMAAFVMSLASRGYTAKPVPAWLSTTFLGRCGLRRWLCMDQYLPVERQPPFATLKNGTDNSVEADADAASLKGSDSSDAKELTRSLRLMLGRYSAEQLVQQGGGEWPEIARVVDRLLFVVFVILFMLTSISLLS